MAALALDFEGIGKVEISQGAKVWEALQLLNEEVRKDVIGLKMNDALLDLSTPLTEGGIATLIRLKDDSEEAKFFYRHSFSHILAQAVRRLFPGTKLAIGPAIDGGFYYDFDTARPFTETDLESISSEMEKIIKENHRFERLEVSEAEARKMLEEQDEPYKLELFEEFAGRGEAISFYRDGDFLDMCRGPHIRFTNQVKHFKLLDVAGAYWRGDEKRKMLQRIYGTA